MRKCVEMEQQDMARRAAVELYWIPLGAGEPLPLVRVSGRVFEAVSAAVQRRPRRPLFHSALQVDTGAERYVIEMAPVWKDRGVSHGGAGEGPVGFRWLGRSQWFRYEVRCWPGGSIPDLRYAVDSPVTMSTDPATARQVVDLAATFPPLTWGRDELGTGEMWNSNTLVSWLLVSSGHDLSSVQPPGRGRAPGWDAGLVAAARGHDGPLAGPRS